MPQLLRPYEFGYLYEPFWSKEEDLLDYVIRDLCFREVLRGENRMVYIHPKSPRPLLRAFIRPGVRFSYKLNF